MPVCYCLVVSESSSQDAGSGQSSVFHLIEGFNIESRGTYVPFEILSWWSFDPDEYGVDYEARLEVYSGSQLVAQSPTVTLQSSLKRLRLRLVGFPIPLECGELIVRMVHKNEKSEWVMSAAYWSMTLVDVVETAESGT